MGYSREHSMSGRQSQFIFLSSRVAASSGGFSAARRVEAATPGSELQRIIPPYTPRPVVEVFS